MPRIKKTDLTFKTRREFENALDRLAIRQLKREKMIADYNAEKARQDREHKAALKRLNAQISEDFEACENFVEINRAEILGDRQSGETKLADFGFRKSPGILKVLNSKWTFAKSIAALKAAGKSACVKVTESLNKSAVKSSIPEDELGVFGLRMDYPEEFWIEAKRVTDPAEKKITSES